MAWVISKTEGRTAGVWIGGTGIGAVVVAMWWLSGRCGHVLEHPVTVEDIVAGALAAFRYQSWRLDLMG